MGGEKQKGHGLVDTGQPGAIWSESKFSPRTMPGAHSALFSAVYSLLEFY